MSSQARAIEDGIYNVECQLYAAKADLEASEPQQQPAKPVLQLKILAWSCAEEPAEQSLTDQVSIHTLLLMQPGQGRVKCKWVQIPATLQQHYMPG